MQEVSPPQALDLPEGMVAAVMNNFRIPSKLAIEAAKLANKIEQTQLKTEALIRRVKAAEYGMVVSREDQKTAVIESVKKVLDLVLQIAKRQDYDHLEHMAEQSGKQNYDHGSRITPIFMWAFDMKAPLASTRARLVELAMLKGIPPERIEEMFDEYGEGKVDDTIRAARRILADEMPERYARKSKETTKKASPHIKWTNEALADYQKLKGEKFSGEAKIEITAAGAVRILSIETEVWAE